MSSNRVAVPFENGAVRVLNSTDLAILVEIKEHKDECQVTEG